MWIFKRPAGNSRRTSARQPLVRRRLRRLAGPRLELLELRHLLASDVVAAVDADHRLEIVGSDSPQQLTLQVDAERNSLELHDAATFVGSFPLDSFRSIDLQLLGGDDHVQVVDPELRLETFGITWSVDAGDGDDIVQMGRMALPVDAVHSFRDALTIVNEVQAIIGAMTATATNTLTQVTEGAIEQARTQITDLAARWHDVASQDSFTQLQSIMDSLDSATFAQFDALLAEVHEAVAQAELLVAEGEDLMGQEYSAHPVARINGAQVETAVTDTMNRLIDRSSQIGEPLSAMVEGVESSMMASRSELEATLEGMTVDADAIEAAGKSLEEATETNAARWESEPTSAQDAILAQSETLHAVLARAAHSLEPMAKLLESLAADARAVKSSDTKCRVDAKHTFSGGSGNDIFFPFAAPSQSWTINGGAGADILFGGFADDAINGGAGTDLIFGLKGNDLIHGDDDTDLLFGEFLFDLSFMTGDDCVYGDAGIDLVIGDNGIDSGTVGGNDDLHGGDDQDLVIGDDVTDVILSGPGGRDTLAGDDELDILFGTGANDTVFGGKHIDVMFGGEGDDVLYANDTTYANDGWTIPSTSIVLGSLQFGGPGKDRIYGADGVDVQLGGTDADTLYGKKYIDLQLGQQDDDTMYGESGGVLVTISSVPIRLGNLMLGGAGKDTMWGGGDLDVMLGNGDDDAMYGYDGNFEILGIDADVMLGGPGNDTMEGDDESVLLVTSVDWMFGQDGDDTMRGGRQGDYLFGGNGDDTIDGDSEAPLLINSNDRIFGQAGNDLLRGGNGLDAIFGGAGDDILYGDAESWWLATSFDFLDGQDGNDQLHGGSQRDIMLGGDGDDTMHGDSGALTLLASNDVMLGQNGQDTMHGGNGKDWMLGGSGGDQMWGDGSVFGTVTSQDIMFGEDGDDVMDGGANQDLMFGNDGCDDMQGDNGASWMILSLDIMSGGADCDTMRGGRATDLMWGQGGIDTMDGQFGLDLMWGGADTDRMSGGDWTDLMWGNDGGDVMSGNNGFDIISGNDGDDCLNGDNGNDVLVGGSGNDCMRGGNNADWMAGGDGNDTMFGEQGMDFMLGGNGNDRMDGGSQSDFMLGNAGHDIMWGGTGADVLFGGTGNDTLIGGSGWDLLVGGPGNDNTTQGGGNSSGLSCGCVILPCKFDFGDLPNTYGTLLSSNGARHGMGGPRLGPGVDAEPDGQPSPNADGDDLGASDDEDGVSIGALLIGSSTNISVQLSGAPVARLDAWIDFDGNGLFNAGEQIANNLLIAAGVTTLAVNVPGAALPGNTFARFRVSSQGGLGATGMAMDGEVEDYRIELRRREELDFGDAPDTYGTTLANNGARHAIGGPILGSLIDVETDGQPSASANRDDNTSSDDEDGIWMGPLSQGGVTDVIVTLGNAASAVVDAWIDFDGNGIFDHPAEHVFQAAPLTAGPTTLVFVTPLTAAPQVTYARFRVSAAGGLLPTGFGGPGEVEDYRVTIASA